MSYSTGAEISRSNRAGRKYSLEEAKNKTYLIKAQTGAKGVIQGYVSFPRVLTGHRIRITILEEEAAQ